MRGANDQRGFSLLELLVALSISVVALSALASLLVDSSRVNRGQQMVLDAQANARGCLSLVAQTLRTAGWNPEDIAGMRAVTMNPDVTAGVLSSIEVFADLNEDGDVADPGESILIRHRTDRLEWRQTSDTSQPFEILGVHLVQTLDDGGAPLPMFSADDNTAPTQITVRITAESSLPDPRTGQHTEYALSSDIALRSEL